MSITVTETAQRLSNALVTVLLADGPHFLDLQEALPWARKHRRTRGASPGALSVVEAMAARPEALSLVVERISHDLGCDRDELQTELDRLLDAGLIVDDTGAARRQSAAPGAASDLTALDDIDVADQRLLLVTPWLLHLDDRGYACLDHDGNVLVRLTALDVALAGNLASPSTVGDALAALHERIDPARYDQAAAEALVRTLRSAGLLRSFDPENPEHLGAQGRQERDMRKSIGNAMRHRAEISSRAEVHAAEEAEREARTGIRRTRVIPAGNTFATPLALGMVTAYAASFEDGRLGETFDFFPHWCNTESVIAELSEAAGIFLFSNYIWNHNGNIELSRIIKEHNTDSITIHGGPDTPRREHDIERHFRDQPNVDVVVRGEGEQTFAELLAALEPQFRQGATTIDLGALRTVPGVSYRTGDQVVHGPDRERLSDLDVIPSPYLTGLFDSLAASGSASMAIIETNRGCPYSCTFCDWGAATNSRIRKFDLERIFDEMEWCAKAQIPLMYFADANFGIFPRDVEIAQKAADLHAEYGYPKRFATNYAKNTVKHLQQIIEIIANAGIATEGLLSLQSMDESTLEAIHRHNIKTEKYEDLATQFRQARLPLFVDLMMGLPGQTYSSFKADVQQCIDREVTGKIFGVEMLVNSPMNDPQYREQHGLTVSREPGPSPETSDADRRHAFVVSSATFTQDDYQTMNRLRRGFFITENLGILRQISRFVRQEAGISETDFLQGVLDRARLDKESWPTLAVALLAVPDLLAPPISWRHFIDEVRLYLTDVLGIEPSSALETVLTVQHAMLPTYGRRFPLDVDLDHDFGAWHAAMMEAKDAGHINTWMDRIPRLESFGPGSFSVSDPAGVCRMGLGYSVELDTSSSLELDSPVARAMPASFAITD